MVLMLGAVLGAGGLDGIGELLRLHGLIVALTVLVVLEEVHVAVRVDVDARALAGLDIGLVPRLLERGEAEAGEVLAVDLGAGWQGALNGRPGVALAVGDGVRLAVGLLGGHPLRREVDADLVLVLVVLLAHGSSITRIDNLTTSMRLMRAAACRGTEVAPTLGCRPCRACRFLYGARCPRHTFRRGRPGSPPQPENRDECVERTSPRPRFDSKLCH